MSRLRTWSDNIWIAEAPLRFYGVPFGSRMTVIRLNDGSLLLHSPIAITPELRSELALLGPVSQIVSPNKLHHLFLSGAMATYPDARLHVPPGLVEKRPDLSGGALLTDKPPDAWAGTLEQLVVRGSRTMQEVVFYHPRSRTLILADLCEHFGRESHWLAQVVARVFGMYGHARMPPDWRMTFRDRESCRASFQHLLNWDFDRVILAHGALLEANAKPVFTREYAWALA